MPTEALPWLNQGDTAWQVTAATLVGLMSVPGLVVLYGGVMQKRWSINCMMLTFLTFAIVLVIWVLYAFKMGFGNPWLIAARHPGFLQRLHRQAGPVAQPRRCRGRGQFPVPTGTRRRSAFPKARWSTSSSCSPRSRRSCRLGSVLGRVNFKAWSVSSSCGSRSCTWSTRS